MLECADLFSIFAGRLLRGASTYRGKAEGRMKNVEGGRRAGCRFPIADSGMGLSAIPGAIRDGVFFDLGAA
jgi:hypothetical protein